MTTYAMKPITLTFEQNLLLSDYIHNKTGTCVMMVSVKWRRPYTNTTANVRGNQEYQSLHPVLKDIVQQLAMDLLKLFKKKGADKKLITSYCATGTGRPTAENPDPRGWTALYINKDEARDEEDYWVTFGDTGKSVFVNAVNTYGVEVGAGVQIGAL